MTLPCPHLGGGPPPGSVPQLGEEVGSGLAATPGSICGSQAMEGARRILLLPRVVLHCWSRQLSSTSWQNTTRKRTSGGGLGRLGFLELRPKPEKATEGHQSLHADLSVSDQA